MHAKIPNAVAAVKPSLIAMLSIGIWIPIPAAKDARMIRGFFGKGLS